jgi:hypothetical protein
MTMAVVRLRPTSSSLPAAADHVLTTSGSSGSRVDPYATPKSHSIRRTLEPCWTVTMTFSSLSGMKTEKDSF